MNRTLTCILCPNGCELEIVYEGTQIQSVSGNKCPKGAGYAEQEIKNPMRNIASSVNLEGGTMPLVSVRLTGPIPKAKIMDVMAEIRKASVKAPVQIGDVVIADVLGLGCDVVATRNVGIK
ncbi:MAG: DUF1667 domain-containing protein [Firmicutes bacterium]|nr:DUF1667 domain-containing protein [Lachnospiraceae bacterium]MBQ8589817.1 DUF1667 domain-containing protein [Bacillota bacterium]